MRSGMLPINAMIILVMGVLVLVGVLALFLGVWKPAAGGTSLQATTAAACQQLITRGCATTYLGSITINDFDASKGGGINPGTVIYACDDYNYFNGATNNNVTCLGERGDPPLQDNLFNLCRFYYGCSMTWGYGDCDNSWNCYKSANANKQFGTKNAADFNTCCRKQVCGCP